ncbi:hypothetical protein KM043_009674 [Ampulex compressa]|nr:hypothetical protein KM043_009674 [Ampulex compressa]
MIILNANLLFIHKWIFVIQPSSNAESGLSVFPLPSTLPSPFKKGKSSYRPSNGNESQFSSMRVESKGSAWSARGAEGRCSTFDLQESGWRACSLQLAKIQKVQTNGGARSSVETRAWGLVNALRSNRRNMSKIHVHGFTFGTFAYFDDRYYYKIASRPYKFRETETHGEYIKKQCKSERLSDGYRKCYRDVRRL